MKFLVLAFAALFGTLTSVGLSCVAAQDPPTDVPDLSKLSGQAIEVRLTDGSRIGPVEVTEATAGDLPGSLESLQVQPPEGKRSINLSVRKIDEIFQNDTPLDVTYDRKNRCLVFDAEKRKKRLEHRHEVEERLSATRYRYWKPLSEEQQSEFMTEHRAFLEKTKKAMPQVPFRLVETKYFLFMTDLTPPEVDGYIVLLDAMYKELCKAFGLSPDKNIWAGKCVVVAFRSPQNYYQFESVVMNHPDVAGTQGLCHQSSTGTVIFAGYKGDNNFFGHVLVHETSHGFVHRYMTTVVAPSWLNEGMADWLADKIVGGNKIAQRQKLAAQQVMQVGGWGDFLTAEHIAGQHYGCASVLVEILLAMDRDGTKFREFFDGIKEGEPADQSLKESYGISYQDLKLLYAKAVSRMR